MNIELYKKYLDEKTEQAMSGYKETDSRYHSFKYCLDFLENINCPDVLEIGTSRSFVDGAFEGCNSNNSIYWDPNNPSIWDWGAGVFSLIFGQAGFNLTTVDICDEHIRRCKIMTDSLGIKCNHVVSDSVKFLKETNKKYDLIYLDSFDMHPINPAIEGQLEEVKIIVERNLLKPNGLILLDDVLNKTPREYGNKENTFGKSQKSIPYLIDHRFDVIFEGYQYIMKKIS